MTHDNKPARVAGPFGYTQRNLSALTPGERAGMRRELDALDDKLQWGFEPGRWAKGAAWHGDDWPEPKLLGGVELAGGFDRRDDLIAEADDFRATLDGADKAWKTQAGLNSPFLPALAAWPQHRREQMRERSKAIRDLVAFGETPERWARGIEFMRDDLRDPQADTGRLVALHGQRHDLLPAIDAMDHALDYRDAAEAEAGADSPEAPPDGDGSSGYPPLPEPDPAGPQAYGTDGIPGMIAGGDRPDSEYPPEDWAVPLPHVDRPKKPLPSGAPPTPWSRFADGWRGRWARLGGLPSPDVFDPVMRPRPDGPVPMDDLVELASKAESGDSGASAQPVSGSADGSSTGGGDGPTLTGPGGEGQVGETPAPASGEPAPDVNPHAQEAAGHSGGGADSREPVIPENSDATTDSRFPDKWAAKGWGGPRGPYQVPTLTDEPERVANIQDDRPARFVVKENPDANREPVEGETPWYGWDAVRENDSLIEEAAKKYGTDPDLIRAVMWTEASLFHRGGLDKLADFVGLSDSSLPMNIHRETWAQVIDADPDDLRRAETNVEAGAALLKRITDRIEDPTPAKIGSVWNYSGRQSVNDYGAYVGRIYREKPWRAPEPAGPEFDPFAAP